MTDNEPTSSAGAAGAYAQPEIRSRRRGSFSLVWFVPIIAALIGIALIIRAMLSAGTDIEISFKSAEGLQSGRTEVRYKDVVVGMVQTISLSEDLQQVVVSVELERHASKLAVEDTRFWVVRPRVDPGGISGLGTLVSGVYISLDAGKSKEQQRSFVGLETAPAVTSDREGTGYVLRATGLGSLGVGSPVYYRRIPVGRVGAYELDADGRSVTLQVFVDAPYDRFVTRDTRFWNASGIDLSLGASGLKVNTESLASVLAGGVAFQTPEEGEPAPTGSIYWLHEGRDVALAPPSGRPVRVRMRFTESVRGLVAGAPVDFHGVEFGNVESVELEYDEQRRQLFGSVVARMFPKRLGDGYERMRALYGNEDAAEEDVLARLVEEGLRAQLRSGNLLTGQLYVALEIPSGKRRAGRQELARDNGLLVMPTEQGSFAQLQTQIASIVDSFSKVPFEDLGRDLNASIRSADALLKRLEGELTPAATQALTEAQRALESANRALLSSDSGLQQDARQTMYELERAGRSLRSLADFLQRHPESLIRGKGVVEENKPERQEEKP